MELGKSLSVKDFFNYYFAGVIWLLVLAALILPISDQQSVTTALQTFKTATDSVGILVTGILAVIIPYVSGFIMNPLGSFMSRLVRRLFGDPVNWITDYSTNKHKGERLPKSLIKAIVEQAPQGYSITEKNIHRRFFQIRADVVNKGGVLSELASRAQDLATFTESLLIPVPLLSGLLVARLAEPFDLASLALAIAIAIATLYLLVLRYLKMRHYWVKHIYRAFLVLKADEIGKKQSVAHQ